LGANWEGDVFVEDPDLAQQLDRKFQADLRRSAEVVVRPRRFLPKVPGFGEPGALVAERPDLAEATGIHRRSGRELRRRALQHAAGLSRAAHIALVGPLVIGMVVMIVVLLLFPLIASYVTAAILIVALAFLVLRGLLRQPQD